MAGICVKRHADNFQGWPLGTQDQPDSCCTSEWQDSPCTNAYLGSSHQMGDKRSHNVK